MSAVIPCARNTDLKKQIIEFAEVLKTATHALGTHGLSEAEFYQSGILEGAIQRIRGQYSATMHEKRDFVARVLNHMQDREFIKDWQSAGGSNRHDYSITLMDGRISVVELKGWAIMHLTTPKDATPLGATAIRGFLPSPFCGASLDRRSAA